MSLPPILAFIVRFKKLGNQPDCWGSNNPNPWMDSGDRSHSSIKFGKISVVNFSLPLDWADRGDSGHESSFKKFRKYLERALNDAIKVLAFPNHASKPRDVKFVEVVSKFNPIKCSTVLSESKLKKKSPKSKDGDTCLVHRKKIIGVCQCPSLPIGECCHRDKSLYVKRISRKYSEFPAEIIVRSHSLSQWLQPNWYYILRSAESRLKTGIYANFFTNASITSE
ncbi:hypothetical protein Aduo_004526 [Ancylostoma duodenale]